MTVAVDVTDMFTEFDIISLQLMMLAADRPLDPLPGLQFQLRPMCSIDTQDDLLKSCEQIIISNTDCRLFFIFLL